MAKGKIHIGTSGWSYKHWRDIYYPPEVKPRDYLAFYAKEFQVSEINTSFYHLPKASTLETWGQTVNSRFRFCPKLSRYVTHMKKLNDPEQTLPSFFGQFEELRKKLGPVLIQLPPSLAYHEEKIDTFFRALRNYKGFTYALEPRHASWLQSDAVALMKKHRIAFVIAESGNRWPSGEFVTAKNIYLRFHGPDGSYARSYSTRTLQKYADKMLRWQQEGHTVWAFFNNDGNGYALANARTLIKLTQHE
jgi:uncharacterized protein YecE (DUF72 family)